MALDLGISADDINTTYNLEASKQGILDEIATKIIERAAAERSFTEQHKRTYLYYPKRLNQEIADAIIKEDFLVYFEPVYNITRIEW